MLFCMLFILITTYLVLDDTFDKSVNIIYFIMYSAAKKYIAPLCGVWPTTCYNIVLLPNHGSYTRKQVYHENSRFNESWLDILHYSLVKECRQQYKRDCVAHCL